MTSLVKRYPNPYFQSILTYLSYIDIYHKYNNAINNHKLNDNHNFTEIQRFEELLSTNLSTIISLNSSNIRSLPELGRGSYGITVNRGNGTVVKTQRDSELFSVFKEGLIQQKLSSDPLYGHCVPYVFSISKDTRNATDNYRIHMEKIDSSVYIRFDKFIHKLSINALLSNQQKIIILLKKLIGLSIVLKYFQNTYGFVHNDLKSDNFYISNDISNFDLTVVDTDLKIIDFGLSCIEEGGNYIISQPAKIENCDLIFYSKMNPTNGSKSSDFIYLLFTMFKSYNGYIRSIFGPYYNDFENSFISSVLHGTTIYNVSLMAISNDLDSKYSFSSFVASKNVNIVKKSITTIYKMKYGKSVLNATNNIIIQNLVNNFYSKFLPDNIPIIFNLFVTRHLSHPIVPPTPPLLTSAKSTTTPIVAKSSRSSRSLPPTPPLLTSAKSRTTPVVAKSSRSLRSLPPTLPLLSSVKSRKIKKKGKKRKSKKDRGARRF